MQLLGIVEKNPTSAQDFLSFIETAKELRSTESTNKNDQSSRSHAICRIRVVDKSSPDSPEGTLLLVDLAGSEASADTQHHSRERMTETREINKSLTVLKDCIRTRALWSISRGEGTQKHMHIPYRSTKLTQVLKSAFDVNSTQTCKTLVIACINPSILDVAHSKNTLRYAEMLKVEMPKAKPRAFDARIPTTWANKDVRDWIKKNVSFSTQFCGLRLIVLNHAVRNSVNKCRVIGPKRRRDAILPSERGRICRSGAFYTRSATRESKTALLQTLGSAHRLPVSPTILNCFRRDRPCQAGSQESPDKQSRGPRHLLPSG